MSEFKRGDVARLKSGGPLMTLSIPQKDGTVQCYYFDTNHNPNAVNYHVDMLERVSPVSDDGVALRF